MALIQIRRGTAASWTSENPILEAGEFGLETDTGKTKIGNGSTAWTSLTYNYVTYAQIDDPEPLGKSVAREGVREPVTVTDQENGESVIWNGHHRIVAAYDPDPNMEVPVTNL